MSLSDQMNQLYSNVISSSKVTDLPRKSPVELRDNSPLSTLDGDPFAFSSISYPRDVTMDMQNGHYMLFYINVQNKTKFLYESADPSLSKIGELVTTSKPAGPGSERDFGVTSETNFVSYGDTDASYRANIINKGGKGSITRGDVVNLKKGRKAMAGFSSVMPTTTRITDSIALYMPADVKDTTSASYNGAEMGVLGLAAASGGKFIQDFQSQDFASAVKNLAGSAKGLVEEAVLKIGGGLASAATLGTISSEDITGLANKAFGRATNPYMEVLFDKVGMRSFSYSFTFSPRNADETNDVQTIIKMFRFHMLPELKGTNQRYMTLPSTFDIHYMYQFNTETANENQFYNKIATCVLNNVTVDYTPDGVKSFASGAPTQIKMSLSFDETEMLTKQHVDKGY
jgi:hypothetical protein